MRKSTGGLSFWLDSVGGRTLIWLVRGKRVARDQPSAAAIPATRLKGRSYISEQPPSGDAAI